MTWFQVTDLKRKEREAEICAEERANILDEFKIIQGEVQELLTQNIEGPENEIIPIQEFNLEIEYANHLKSESIKKCEQTKAYLEALIAAQDKVTKWCKAYFWDRMFVQGKSIWAIFGNFDVENYVLLPNSNEKEAKAALVEQLRKTEDLLAKYDSFQPWMPYTESELEGKLQNPPYLAKPDEGPDISDSYDEEEEKEEQDPDQILANSATLACRYIELNPWHYIQEERQTFWMSELQYILASVSLLTHLLAYS